MDFGLTKSSIDAIQKIFDAFPQVKRVKIFGSRAMGKQREGSDVDLAVEGDNLTMNDILGILVKLDNLELPYRFDVVNMATTTQRDLLDHIARVGVTIFVRGP